MYIIERTITDVDTKTGRVTINSAKKPSVGKVVRDICPGPPGTKDWQPLAFSPRTGLLYIPHQNLCMEWQSVQANYIAGTLYVGANVRMYAGPGGNRLGTEPRSSRSGSSSACPMAAADQC